VLNVDDFGDVQTKSCVLKFNRMGEIVEVAEFAWDKAGDLNGDKGACDGANMWNGACAVDIGAKLNDEGDASTFDVGS
jgi:hypothetical protein